MSRTDNAHQAERWLRTAEEDLRAVAQLAEAGFNAQACFFAQQSAEKAMKALWYLHDADPWGHSIQRLLLDFPEQTVIPDMEGWLSQAALLDKLYIPTRYPNGLPDLTPGQVYRDEDADRACYAARMLVAGCRNLIVAQDDQPVPEVAASE